MISSVARKKMTKIAQEKEKVKRKLRGNSFFMNRMTFEPNKKQTLIKMFRFYQEVRTMPRNYLVLVGCTYEFDFDRPDIRF